MELVGTGGDFACAPLRSACDGASREKLAWLLATRERMRAISPFAAIPKRDEVSTEEFRDQHYAANWPVLLAGAAADWPAVRRWTPQSLTAAVGAAPVEVQTRRTADTDYERNMAAHKEVIAFDAFIDRISPPDVGNDVYLTANNAGHNAEALRVLEDDLGFLDRFLNRDDSHYPRGMPWIGASGSFTPLHHDLTNNLMVQIVGRKTLLLAAPGETSKLYNDHHVFSRIRDLTAPDVLARFPKLDGIRIHRLVLNPGDALFIPVGWWHQVTALDFSVTYTHTNFLWPNDAFTDHPAS